MAPPPTRVRIRAAEIVTMDADHRIVEGDLVIDDGVITQIDTGDGNIDDDTPIFDARGLTIIPGLVQGHVHLGQSLFRGLAEDRQLLSWLADRVWPLEAAHTRESSYWSAMLGIADMVLSGTTAIQDIGVVRGMDGLLEAVRDTGMRALAGKCLMDSGEGVPALLAEPSREGLTEAVSLYEQWHGTHGGRITINLCPRFILSCSQPLWEGCVELAHRLGTSIHTHLLETPEEAQAVRDATGREQMAYLDELGVLDTPLCIAHGVCFDREHQERLAGRPLSVIHCPSSNLKLGSGIADLGRLQATPGVKVGLGTDGAPCNNDYDQLEEMRLAALLQQHKQGPGKFSARDALALATIDGARAIGLGDQIGSIEIGKKADLVFVDLNRPATFGPQASIYHRIVYAAARDSVRHVLIDGQFVVRDGTLVCMDPEALARRPAEELQQLLTRAELT